MNTFHKLSVTASTARTLRSSPLGQLTARRTNDACFPHYLPPGTPSTHYGRTLPPVAPNQSEASSRQPIRAEVAGGDEEFRRVCCNKNVPEQSTCEDISTFTS